MLQAWNPSLSHLLENQSLSCCHLVPPGFRKFCLQPQQKGHRVSAAGTYRAGSLAERAAGQMGLARGRCLELTGNRGLGRVWLWSQPELGIWGLREVRHSHHDLSPSYVPMAAGQDCPHLSLGPLSLRASFRWVVWASCHQPELTLSQQGLPPPTASSPCWVPASVASALRGQVP